MKFIYLLIIACSIGICSNSQDSTKHPAADSIAVFKVGNELMQFMQENNLGIKDYQLVVNVYNAYIKQKQLAWRPKR